MRADLPLPFPTPSEPQAPPPAAGLKDFRGVGADPLAKVRPRAACFGTAPWLLAEPLADDVLDRFLFITDAL